ncbi:DUF2508 domain-containing protein [Paenibacillus sediminis]|uniref:DUF2508 family protein n=1 Tax=Paenibacillus sediminis TaxID=664909 RepID=A0ABS4H8M3_9BACL|nr:DUF2508 domain-containing protein [Paenibacillus sediminis]MBP1938617.1 hypothetical protein [Paenibacillus sediminis]
MARREVHIHLPLINQDQEQEKRRDLYIEVIRAHAEWVRAQYMFQEAVGNDEIDYAIYMLEAAERIYDIRLRQAKKLGLNTLEVLKSYNA